MRVLNIVSDSAEPSASIHHVHHNIELQLRALGLAVETKLLTGKPHEVFGQSLEKDFDVLRRPRKHPLKYWLLRRRLRRAIVESRCDWIIIDGLLAANIIMSIEAKLPASLRYLLVVHGRVKLVKPKLTALTRRLRRRGIHGWKLVAVSSDSAEFLLEQLPRDQHGGVSVIENCIDSAAIRSVMLSREAACLELQIDPNKFVFGTIGRMSPEKDYATLLKAFAELGSENAQLVLVGDGKQRPHLVRQAETLGISDKVVFAGYKSNAIQYLAAMDCFVMTSTTEGSPIALLEALAAARPVICSRIPPLESALPGSYPFLFEVGNSTSLRDRMSQYMGLSAAEQLQLGTDLRQLSDGRFSPALFGHYYAEMLSAAG